MTKEAEAKELRESNELTHLVEMNMVAELEELLAVGYNINGYNKVISVCVGVYGGLVLCSC